jgi:radical SAM superfamily enzyme YgiQ (UPF0313 family)
MAICEKKSVLLIQPAVIEPKILKFGSISNGLIALAQFLYGKGYPVKIIHFFGLTTNIERMLANKINMYNPRIIGVNLTWHVHIQQALEIASIIKKIAGNIPVVFGGLTASQFDIEILEYLRKENNSDDPVVDFIIRGDGELPFLHYLRTGHPPEYNVTIASKYIDHIRKPLSYVQKSLPRVTFESTPAEIIDDWPNYINREGIRTSIPKIEQIVGHNLSAGEFDLYLGKGCVNNCCYCGGGKDILKKYANRNGVLFRNISDIRNDIQKVIKAGVQNLYINFDPDYHRYFFCELFETLPKLKCNLIFSAWSGPIHSDLLDKIGKIFDQVEIVISPESGSENLRRRLIDKGLGKRPYYTNDELMSFFMELHRRNFKAMCHFTTGLPFESIDDRQMTESFASSLEEHCPQIFRKQYDARIERNICSPPLYIEPGSPIALNPEKFNMSLTRRTFKEFLNNSKRDETTDILGVKRLYNSSELDIIRKSQQLLSPKENNV